MFALTESHRFYLLNIPTDMRKSFDTLSGLVHSKLGRNPLSGEVFVFVNKSRNRIKLLHWQGGGFVLYYKRLEKGTFEVFRPHDKEVELSISYAELTMIIHGIQRGNIQKRKRFSK